MRSKVLLSFLVVGMAVLLSAECFGMSYKRWDIPGFVKDSNIIAKGNISIEMDKPVLNVEKTFKGKSYSKLAILTHKMVFGPEVKFRDGQQVLLFLSIPQKDGAVYLLGAGDQAIWPKDNSDPNIWSSYDKILSKASLKEIEAVVENLLQIENTADEKKRTELCDKNLKSNNKLIQFTTLQYVLHRYIWPAYHTPELYRKMTHAESKEHFSVLRKFSYEAVKIVDCNEPAIQGQAVRLLRYALPSIAIPKLIPLIDSPDKRVRAYTRTVLHTFMNDGKFSRAALRYKADDSMEKIRAVKQNWANKWLGTTVNDQSVDTGDIERMTARITAISDSGVRRASYYVTFTDIENTGREICCLLDGEHKLLEMVRKDLDGKSWWNFVYKNGENKINKQFVIIYSKSGKKPHRTPNTSKCDEIRELFKWKLASGEESRK